MNLKDKVIIITGASSGIGLAATRQLVAQGARVAMVAPDSAELQSAARELDGALAIATDMTDEASVRAMVQTVHKHFGRIDVLLNNAGRGYEGPLEFIEPSKFLYLFKLHVIGPLVATQSVIPIMREQGGGRIINTSSPTANIVLPGLGAYSATKVALRYMTLVSRKELFRDNIIVSVFYPFITSSNFGKNVFRTKGTSVDPETDRNLPDPDSPEYTASRLVAAIGSTKKEITVRGLAYFIYGVLRKKLRRA